MAGMVHIWIMMGDRIDLDDAILRDVAVNNTKDQCTLH